MTNREAVCGHGVRWPWACHECEELDWAARPASVTHRMAETGTGSGRSLSGAVPPEEAADAQPLPGDSHD